MSSYIKISLASNIFLALQSIIIVYKKWIDVKTEGWGICVNWYWSGVVKKGGLYMITKFQTIQPLVGPVYLESLNPYMDQEFKDKSLAFMTRNYKSIPSRFSYSVATSESNWFPFFIEFVTRLQLEAASQIPLPGLSVFAICCPNPTCLKKIWCWIGREMGKSHSSSWISTFWVWFSWFLHVGFFQIEVFGQNRTGEKIHYLSEINLLGYTP